MIADVIGMVTHPLQTLYLLQWIEVLLYFGCFVLQTLHKIRDYDDSEEKEGESDRGGCSGAANATSSCLLKNK